MRRVLVVLPLLLTGCGSLPSASMARYQIWRASAPPHTYAFQVAPGTPADLADIARTSLAPAGLYEDAGDTAVHLSLSLDVGMPRMTRVEPSSPDWQAAGDDRRFVEVVDRDGRTHLLRASHPSACYAFRHAVLLNRSCLLIEARHDGRPLWCAEIVIIVPEDDPTRLASLFHPAVVEVLLEAAQAGAPVLVEDAEPDRETGDAQDGVSVCTRM